MESEQSQVCPFARDLHNSDEFLYIQVENDLAPDSSIYNKCSLESTVAVLVLHAPEILRQLGWVCTSLQFGISCFLVVYDTDQDSLQNERFFLSRENATKL